MSDMPPIGVMPRWRYEELADVQRIDELSRAIRDYIEDGRQPLQEWAIEIKDLSMKIRRRS